MTTAAHAKEANASATDRPIRALLDVMGGQRNELGEYVDRLPARRFGKGKARILRKFVLLAIAASSDPDGTGARPSRETIARRCLVSVRAISDVLNWLEKHHLVRVESKGVRTSKFGKTNRYEILWQEPVPKKRVKKHQEIELPSAPEAPGTIHESTRNNSQEHQEQLEQAPGTIREALGNRTSHNRPYDRPEDRHLIPPSSDRPGKKRVEGGTGIPSSFSTENHGHVDQAEPFANWMSDVLTEHTGQRHTLSSWDMTQLRTTLAGVEPRLAAITFLRFCNRPKSVRGLSDPFRLLWKEWPLHQKDAEGELADEDFYGDWKEILESAHGTLFQYEYAARENGVTLPSMELFTRILSMLSAEPEVQASGSSSPPPASPTPAVATGGSVENH